MQILKICKKIGFLEYFVNDIRKKASLTSILLNVRLAFLLVKTPKITLLLAYVSLPQKTSTIPNPIPTRSEARTSQTFPNLDVPHSFVHASH
jgi:hypothetical protein